MPKRHVSPGFDPRSGSLEGGSLFAGLSQAAQLELLDRLVVRARAKMEERDALVLSSHWLSKKLANSAFSTANAVVMQPPFACPADEHKTTSAKREFDGGKWLCGFSLLRLSRPHCVVYSLGSNAVIGFEEAVQQRTRLLLPASSRKDLRCDVEICTPLALPLAAPRPAASVCHG